MERREGNTFVFIAVYKEDKLGRRAAAYCANEFLEESALTVRMFWQPSRWSAFSLLEE